MLETDRSCFIKAGYASRMYSNYISNDSYFGFKNTFVDSIRATLGEYRERIDIYNNNQSLTLNAFNLLNGKTIEVPLEEFILNLDLPVMDQKIPRYSDTCGVATHLISSKAIEGALLEFFERQSLIFSWLTQEAPHAVDIKYASQFLEILPSNYKDFEFYIRDISLWNFVKVIIFIGFEREGDKFLIGCSAGFTFQEALEDAFNEAIAMGYYYINDAIYENGVKTYEKFDVDDIKDEYAKNFYSLSKEQFIEQVDYLIQAEVSVSKEYYADSIFKLEYLEKIEMDIFCTIIPNINDELFKTIKVFSPDAYPHMNTKTLDPEKYRISDIFKVKNFPNKHRALPFP